MANTPKMKRDDVPHTGYQALYDGVESPVVEGRTVVKEIPSETALVPVQPQALSHALSTEYVFASDVHFGGSGRPPVRRMTWLTGNNDQFIGKIAIESARGLYLDKPDEDEMSPWDYELEEAMEILCDLGQAREVVVAYIDEKTKQPRKTPSWQFIDPSLFIVCEGVPSKEEMDKDSRCRWGVAYGWPHGAKSRLSFHCFVQQLMKVGYNGAFVVSFSSYTTTKAITALYEYHQNYVLRFIAENREALGITSAVPYYLITLTLSVSTKTLTAGSEERSGTRQVFYPVAKIPRLSLRNLEAALTFLASAKITDAQAEILEADGFVSQCEEWSTKESQRILTGRDAEELADIPGIANAYGDSAPDDNPF